MVIKDEIKKFKDELEKRGEKVGSSNQAKIFLGDNANKMKIEIEFTTKEDYEQATKIFRSYSILDLLCIILHTKNGISIIVHG